MISILKRDCIAVLLLVIVPVNLQVAMYPMFPPPMHVAVPMPVPVPIMVQRPETTTTTTTTTENSVGIGYPVAVPVPMPFPFPAFPAAACQSKKRPKNCPPCPPCLCLPSCTPAFYSYCSPCHKKCRCRSKEDTPTPKPPKPMGPPYGIAVPVPHMLVPPPVVVIPFPPPRPPRPSSTSTSCENADSDTESDCTDTESDCSSSSSYEQRKKRKRKSGHVKRRPHRRMLESIDTSGNELVKPVLTYISKNGDVKLKRRLSNDEAAELMNDKPYQNINVVAGEDEENRPRILISSKNKKPRKATRNFRRKQIVLTPGNAQHMLGEGKKELVFRPPGGKKISNLSVSFQISE